MKIPSMILTATVVGPLWLVWSRGKRRSTDLTIIILATTVALLAIAAPALAELPTPVSAATAITYLSTLKVEPQRSLIGYSRVRFLHWITISGTCDTRETVLKRDGNNVVTDTACKAVSGQWVSPYDGVTSNNARELDIGHIVPLPEAWASGADTWDDAQRKAFANDLTQPALLAVSAKSNRSKGDKDPAEWMPPLASFHCVYVRAWVQVKYTYQLSVDSAEKTKLSSVLAEC
ncbi:hypothetical protein CPC16_005944 [Podila verticillata]|nr:hypothetical protein CPC16_005944 [Podila verticillata]KFH69730.1 hypothetical protein MVEG_04536 [Podila verticillata NRRL 6337]